LEQTLAGASEHADMVCGKCLYPQESTNRNLKENMITQSPTMLSDICGAADIGDLDPKVISLEPNKGVLLRGSVICINAGGKGELAAAGNENNSFGILLDSAIDTAVPFSNGNVTGSVGRHGSYKADQLLVGVGTDAVKLEASLRQEGCLLEGSLVVPAA
jgi:hypothetical protein